MKTKHLLFFALIFALTGALSSCSSSYRTGQTPDDVYYSPAPPPPVEYVRTDDRQGNGEDLTLRGTGNTTYPGNISLDFGYGYNPYDYFGTTLYNPYSYYNPYAHTGVTFYPYNCNYNYYSYYSPFNNYYYPPVYFYVSKYSGPRTYNLGVYNNNNNTNRVYTHPGQSTTNNAAPVRTFRAPAQQPANRSGVGNFIRRVFTPSDNVRSPGNDNNNSSPARNIQTNSSGGGSHSSGSGGAPVRSFR